MALVTLHSGDLSLELDPERGGEVVSIAGADGRNALAHHTWDAPLEAGDGPGYGSTELDWLSRYRAGWQFLFPNAGAESSALGIPVAFHGESSLARVSVVDRGDDFCVIRTTARLPLELTRTIRLASDAPVVLVEESVVNVGAVDVPFLWGHHPTFPAVPGSRIDLPSGARFEVEPSATGDLDGSSARWPHATATDGSRVDLSELPDERMVRLLYLSDLATGWVAVRPPRGAEPPGVAMCWDLAAYPFLWIWLQNGDPGFPWYGRARMLGLEPQRAWPFDGLAGAHDRGQALVLEPGATVRSWLTLTLLPDGAAAVTGMDRAGRVAHD